MQTRVDELVSQNRDKDDELSSVKRDARRKEDDLDLEVKSLKRDLERKEKRLEMKMRKIEELQKVAEEERKKYELTYTGE